jgi:L-fuconolactonase
MLQALPHADLFGRGRPWQSQKQVNSEREPADGTGAAAQNRNFGTSRGAARRAGYINDAAGRKGYGRLWHVSDVVAEPVHVGAPAGGAAAPASRSRRNRLTLDTDCDTKFAWHRGASPMTIIDSQVHAYEANTPKRPWHSVPNWPDHVTGDEMVAAMDEVGVDGAIFISAFSMYRYDASYAVEVQRAHPGRFAIVKPVDPDDPAVADVVADWKKTPGTVGIRIILTQEAKREPNDPGLERILRAAVRHDFPVNILCWGNLDAGTALIDRHPDTRFIIDHLGIMQPRVPPAPPQPWADLAKVLELAKRPNAVIKVSGACTLSREPYPFPDIWDPLARVFDAWGFDRCLWGTDWTRAFAVVNYERAVAPFLDSGRLSDSERAMLMGGACAKAYGWSPKSRRAQ